MKLEDIKKTAIDVLKKNKGHQPQFLFVKGKDVEIVITPFENDEEKDKCKRVIKKYVTQKKPDCYFFISESWMVKRKKEDLSGKRPSECDDRVEVLCIFKYSKDRKNEGKMIEFSNKEGKIKIGKTTDLNGMEVASSFDFYLEDGAFEERIGGIKK